MRKLKFIHFALFVGFATTTAYSQSSTSDEGVVINGVKWATRNVDAPGTFAAKPEDAGMFYQWNRKKAWPATGKVTGWDKSESTAAAWTKANDPCPAGWRMPTVDEFRKLCNEEKVKNEWTSVKGINGRMFTDKATGHTIFLLAADARHFNDGTFARGSLGLYWSSTVNDWAGSYNLTFDSGNVYPDLNNTRAYGFPCRCVSE